ncbi:glycosyltransferase [Allorhodopirellula heiligendammensis]|uniref:glycosyltransferase n=1 Tax=Allorhodopirellula heiligendammensis TaxID=2714739 RepID=UPI0011B6D1F6|nr:glycosyltransferase [Allorhodopirellula heiligendammensis]
MKIVHLSTYEKLGGASLAANRIHRGLIEIGVESHLLCLDGPANADGIIRAGHKKKRSIFKRVFSPNWEFAIRQFAIDDVGIEIFSDIEAQPRNLWRQIPPDTDIVQLNWISRLIDWEDFFQCIPDFPIVWRFADLNPMTGGCHYPDSCKGFMTGCHACPQIGGTKAKRRIASNYHLKQKCIERIPSEQMTIVAQSRWIESLIEQSPIFERFPRVFIPNGVDKRVFRQLDSLFCRNLLRIPDAGPVALIFASHGTARRKGIWQVLDKLDQLHKLPFHLLIVGETTHRIGSRPEVTVTDGLPPSVLPVAYSAADLMLFPSLQDNCPNAVLESQACGTPVLAFDNSGTKELIEDESNGWLVRNQDFDGFVEKAIELVENDRRPSAEAVRKQVRDFHDMLSEYVLAYREAKSRHQ